MTKLLASLIVITLGLAGTSVVAQSVAPRAVTMRDLTVPADRLPNGCSLKVIEPARQETIPAPATRQAVRFIPSGPSLQPLGITLNPWTGTDRRILAALRQRVDGYWRVRLPDAPPLTSSEVSAMLLQFAQGVEEGYAATYTLEGRDLGVWAVRFAMPQDRPLDFHEDGGRGQNVRVIDIGAIRAVLFGDGVGCATAVETHLKSLVK